LPKKVGCQKHRLCYNLLKESHLRDRILKKVLVIDDEPQIRRALRVTLEQNKFDVLLATTAEEGLDLAASNPPDLILLDLAMPEKNGFAVCEELRQWSTTPIIVMSVRNSEQDKVRVLDMGADDFVTKPFGINELMARIRAVLRRFGPANKEEPTFTAKGLRVNLAHRQVFVGEKEVHLTPKEYNLLKHLLAHRDKVVTHRQLLAEVWGPQYESETHTLRVHIANLREKIEKHPDRPTFIHTETGIGYRFRS
jgi:two-component system KDP operon response regulator KdpE